MVMMMELSANYVFHCSVNITIKKIFCKWHFKFVKIFLHIVKIFYASGIIYKRRFYLVINLHKYRFTLYPHTRHANAENQDNRQQSTKLIRPASVNELILSTHSNTAPYYYLDKFARGEMGAAKAVRSYALSNVPFYSYYSIYDKVRHHEVSKDDAIKAVFINALGNLS